MYHDKNQANRLLQGQHSSDTFSAYCGEKLVSVSHIEHLEVVESGISAISSTAYKLTSLGLHVEQGHVLKDAAGSHLEGFDIDDILSAITAKPTHCRSWSGCVVLVVPTKPGYVIRSNCFQDRFSGCGDLGKFLDRTEFGQYHDVMEDEDPFSLLNASVLRVVVPEHYQTRMSELLEEIKARLDFHWLTSQKPSERILALVHGRDNLEAFLPIYRSAKALGISLVVLDRAGHWLLDNTKRHLYRDFLPLDMTINDTFHLRIARLVKTYGWIDGICTVSDRCLAPVARAAELLRLPTQPSKSVALAVNKYETRLLDGGEVGSALVTGVEDLQQQLATDQFKPAFPSIVKPCVGWGSEHVYKVDSEQQMIESVRGSCQTSSNRILIETYIDGPELDVNIVLLDGDIVFFEVSDDFPSPGDNGNMDADFWENANVLPSGLPDSEYAIVRNSLHDLLLRIGFETGVFHLEARVKDSSMEFSSEDGLIDLRSKSKQTQTSPKCFLIEVNPRPPGFPCVLATTGVYGVNMFDIHLLASLKDHDRMQALTKPFNQRQGLPNLGRAWSQIVFFQVTQGGTCTSEDACEETLQKLPHVQSLVTTQMCFYRKGDQVPTPKPGLPLFGAFFILTSRERREDVIMAAQALKDTFYIAVDSGSATAGQ